MSGIAGLIRFDGGPVTPGLIERMTGAMTHRGPDGIGHWQGGSVALGHCLLRTTRESFEEHQPLANEDESLVLVMDGRVDNYDDMRSSLLRERRPLRSRSDTELVLRAYEAWGVDFLRRLDGDFALVVWDARRRQAFCARDRVGNKPFHYHWDGNTFSFASEVHALLGLPWVSEELNEGMVAEFLTNQWVTRDETFWVGIQRLIAAHCLQLDGGEPTPRRYWDADFEARLRFRSAEEHTEHYRSLLTDVVRRLSRSVQPLAIEVSGGLDSSAIFAIAEHLRRAGELPAPSVDGYTLDFGDDPEANDLPYARAVGRHFGVSIAEVRPLLPSLTWYRDWAARYREFPSYPNGVSGLAIREVARASGSRALLCGVGGDQWLEGPREVYADAIGAGEVGRVFRILLADAREAGWARSLGWAVRYGMYPLLPVGARLRLRRWLGAEGAFNLGDMAWLSPRVIALARERNELHSPVERAGLRPTQRQYALMLDTAFGSFARELEERMAASVGIEVRRPLFHPSIVQHAISCPPELLTRGRTTKVQHREALHGLLPELVRCRTGKADFGSLFRAYEKPLEAEAEFWWHTPATQRWLAPGRDRQRSLSGLLLPDASATWWRRWSLFGCSMLHASST